MAGRLNQMMGAGGTPVIVLKEGTDTSQGTPQLLSNIGACTRCVGAPCRHYDLGDIASITHQSYFTLAFVESTPTTASSLAWHPHWGESVMARM